MVRRKETCFERVAAESATSNGREAIARLHASDACVAILNSKAREGSEARALVLTRIDSAIFGNFGDCEFIADGVYEMRIHFGPGYRVYYTRRAERVYLLLAGGDKGTQKRDIRRALRVASEL